MENNDSISQNESFFDAVSHHKNCHLFLLPHIKKPFLHCFARDGIERAKRFVHEQYIWLSCKLTSYCNALNLTS